eukprot:g462.t1
MTLERESSVRHNVDLSLISSVTNPAEIAKLLSEVYNEERTVDAELRSLIDRRDTFEDLLTTAIQESNEVLEVVNADAEQLLRGVTNASIVAEGISSTVKSLDTTQSNVKAALSHISIIVDRSTCVHRLRESMDREDYETATQCVSQFHALQKEISEQPEPHQKQVGSDFSPVVKFIASGCCGIRGVVAGSYQTKNKRRNPKRQWKSNHLFRQTPDPARPRSESREEALESYSTYLKSVVSGKGRIEYQSLSESLESRSKKADFIKHISDLFRSVAVLIEQHQEILVDSFGENATLELIQSLQKECEEHTIRILKRFIEERKVAQIVQEISLRRSKSFSGAPAQSMETVDPRTIENALIDILNLVRRCSEFALFLDKRLELISNSASLGTSRLSRLSKSVLEVQVRELTSFYVNLEEFYLEENVKKAIEIDKLLAGSLVSSMVDDVFFVFRKSASRAISSRSVPCACAILSLMNNLLSQNYTAALQQKLSPGPGEFLQLLISGDEEVSGQKEQTSADFGTFWNNVQISVVYIGKIKEELDQRIEANFMNSKERETVSSILADLSKTSLDLERLMESGKTRLCEILLTKLMPNLQEITKCEYQLDEQSYEQLSEMELWPHHITAQIERYSNQLMTRLTTENHSQVIDALMNALVRRFEVQLMQKKFNQLGGLQLDRDVRLLVTRFSEMTQSAVRERFSRLTQMGTILCFESVEEMLDYWGDEGGSIDWKLSPGEIKSILRLRTDFSESNIAALLFYDVIIVGLGITGCAVLHQLARTGFKVLGIEQRGRVSWSGYSATSFDFHCHPNYFRVLNRSINLWHRLEDATEREFVVTTGSLYCGVFYDEIYDAISEYGLDHEEMRGFKALKRFPQLCIPEREDLLYIDNGGVIDKREAISALFASALNNGAKTRFNERVLDWERTGDLVNVVTDQCEYNSKTLVLCCGEQWIHSLLPELQNVSMKQTETIFEYTLNPQFDVQCVPQMPVLRYDINEAHEVSFWSSPSSESRVFFSMRYPRDISTDMSYNLTSYEESVWSEAAFNVCPEIEGETPLNRWSNLLTGTSDGHFILDWHPAFPQVIIALAGGELGFQCSPALAEIISFMISDKSYAQKILSPFSLIRESLRGKIPSSFLSGPAHQYSDQMISFRGN